MGPGRGGACNYDWIARRLGIHSRKSDPIIPEFQHLQVGDEIRMPGYAMRVERLEPERAMVVRSSNHAWVWSFELRPAGGHTRLVSGPNGSPGHRHQPRDRWLHAGTDRDVTEYRRRAVISGGH